MSTYADYMLMGGKPVAGRVRASMSTCAAGRSELLAGAASAAATRHASWLAAFAPKQANQIAVPDTTGYRRLRGRP